MTVAGVVWLTPPRHGGHERNNQLLTAPETAAGEQQLLSSSYCMV